MFLLAQMTWLGTVLVCVAVGWVALGVGRRMLFCSRALTISLLAVASIVGGFMVFAQPATSGRAVRHVVPHVEVHFRDGDVGEIVQRATRQASERVERRLAELDRLHDFDPITPAPPRIPEVRVSHQFEFPNRFPFAVDSSDDEQGHHTAAPRGMLIALGTVLVIGGWLLFNRDRTRGRALRAVTLLGLAATGAILFTLIHETKREISHSSDRVIRVSDSDEEATSPVPAAAEKPHKAKRPSRAKRPAERADVPASAAVEETLPPRAGEIPVAAELANTQPPSDRAPQSDADQPASVPATPSDPPQAPTAPEVPSKPPADAPAAPASSAEAQAVETTPVDAKPAETPPPAEVKADETKPDQSQPAAPARPNPSEAKASASKGSEAKPVEAPAAPPAPPAPAAEARPAWVETPGKLTDSVYRVAVKSGLYVDVPECQRALDEAIKHNADDYIDQFRGKGAAALVDIDRKFLSEHIKKEEFSEVRQATVGPMHQIHALLEYDDEARALFDERWRQAVVSERLWYVGSAGAVVLALLSTVYGYLKIDLQTSPSHKGRLQLAATLVALIVAAGALLARWAVL